MTSRTPPSIASSALVVGLLAGAGCNPSSSGDLARPTGHQRISVALHGDEPTTGPPGAEVTIVAFVDPAIPTAAQVPAALAAIDAQFPDRARVIYKFPTFQTRLSVLPARALCAADLQGQFAAVSDRLLALAPGRGDALLRPRLSREAAALGLDPDRFRRDLDGERCTDRLRLDREHADLLDVPITPTFVVNGRRVTGASFPRTLSAVVADELALPPAPSTAATHGSPE